MVTELWHKMCILTQFHLGFKMGSLNLYFTFIWMTLTFYFFIVHLWKSHRACIFEPVPLLLKLKIFFTFTLNVTRFLKWKLNYTLGTTNMELLFCRTVFTIKVGPTEKVKGQGFSWKFEKNKEGVCLIPWYQISASYRVTTMLKKLCNVFIPGIVN